LFILVIACINFMNLSTAKASRRLKEVGIKKVVGSSRGMLVWQFLTEAVVMAFLSLALAVVLVTLLLPVFRQITGVPLTVTLTPSLVAAILGTTLLTGSIAGSYPALYLSGFKPVAILKGKMPSSWGELLARKGLVVFQFSISLVLIVAVAVIYRQLEYVQTENLGYNRDNVIYFDKTGTIVPNQEAFLNGLKKVPGVVDASAIESSVVDMAGGSSTYDVHWPGKDEKVSTNFMIRSVDFHMIELLGIPVKEGRSFSPAFGAEDDKLIFNETAIRLMGLKHPVGTKVSMWGKDKTIIGVVKDFHLASLHEPIQPMLFKYDPGSTRMIMAKIRAGQERSALAKVEAFFKQFNPGNVFDYKFLDAQYQAQYVAEQRVSVLSRYFAGLAILISCLGLFGLAAYNAEVRTREIGIRKVLGASIAQVMILLSKDFVRLIGLAMLIAFPLAGWAMQSWLNGFAYHVHLGVWVFVIAGLALFVCALGTVSYQAARAALVNPARSLKAE